MNNVEFKKFDRVFGEKYIGIATVRYDRKFIFRFKVVPKDNGGYWVQPAVYKITKDGKDTYLPSFKLDSDYDSEELCDFVLMNVENFLQQEKQSKSNASVFGSQPLFGTQPQELNQVPQIDDGLPF